MSGPRFEDFLNAFGETCRTGGGIARDRLQQCIVEIGLAPNFVVAKGAVEPGGLERLAASQRLEELLGRDVPQVITDQSLAPHLGVALREARGP